MSDYAEQLQALHNAVVHGESAAHSFPAARLHAYQDSYIARLMDATLADYPATAHYLGKPAMLDATAGFVRHNPSRHWDLNRYPIAFADYLAGTSSNKAAVALARLESAITACFWAEESEALQASSLTALSLEAFAALRFQPRAAARLLALDFAANAYLSAFRADGTPPPLEQKVEYLCLVRHENNVRRLSLQQTEYTLLHALWRGEIIGAALPADMDAATLQAAISAWLQNGVFSSAHGEAIPNDMIHLLNNLQ